MDELFLKRMQNIGVVGNKVVDRTNRIVSKTFKNDQNYQCGTLYDWDLNPLEENVEFKFEKHKTYTAEGNEIDYYIHFLPDYHPEFLFKDAYYRQDGKERLGFYIDVLDRAKGETDRWLIVGKDDRVAMDRYLAYKCNWQLEWIDDHKKWHSILAVVRESIADNIREWETTTSMQGTNVGGLISVIFPTAQHAKTLFFGKRVMVTDNEIMPRCFEVSDMKDASPLGVTKLYLSRSKFNAHTDYLGKITSANQDQFIAVNKIEDLPEDMGGSFHCLCDCMDRSQVFEPDLPVAKTITLVCGTDEIRINGSPVEIQVEPWDPEVEIHYFVDNQEYSLEDLKEYFSIEVNEQGVISVAAINRVMAKYIFKVSAYDSTHTYHSFVELEVKI